MKAKKEQSLRDLLKVLNEERKEYQIMISSLEGKIEEKEVEISMIKTILEN